MTDKCLYPDVQAITAYRYGCRCELCLAAKTIANDKANHRRGLIRKHRKMARKAFAKKEQE